MGFERLQCNRSSRQLVPASCMIMPKHLAPIQQLRRRMKDMKIILPHHANTFFRKNAIARRRRILIFVFLSKL